MTKKDYELIAKVFADNTFSPDSTIDFDAGYDAGRKHLAESLAYAFEDENPRFNRERFLTACGL